MIEVGFYVASAVALFATTMVITNTNPVHALLYLVLSLLAIAMVFFTLGAPFAGVLEVIIYAGAIMVLFLFVVMLLNAAREEASPRGFLSPTSMRYGVILSVLLAVEALWAVSRLDLHLFDETTADSVSSVTNIGRSLFTKHAFAFEATSILILVAMVGAIVLARKET
jgi:NADH-quinone oxidoreductase subunit J